jgi:hypothetical protein
MGIPRALNSRCSDHQPEVRAFVMLFLASALQSPHDNQVLIILIALLLLEPVID